MPFHPISMLYMQNLILGTISMTFHFISMLKMQYLILDTTSMPFITDILAVDAINYSIYDIYAFYLISML